jgi:hypothetical protein
MHPVWVPVTVWLALVTAQWNAILLCLNTLPLDATNWICLVSTWLNITTRSTGMKVLLDINRSTLLRKKIGKSPANLFGFLLPGLGYCPVLCDTVMSRHIARGKRDKLHLPGFDMEKIMDRREKKWFNWDEITGILDGFSSSDELTEIRALLCTGLVPWSMQATWVRGAKVCVQVRIRYLQA